MAIVAGVDDVAYEALVTAPQDAEPAAIADFILDWYGERAGAEAALERPLFLQSLQAAELAVTLEARFGVSASLEQLLAGLTVSELAGRLASAPPARGALPTVVPRPLERYAPFDLTEIQKAYYVGRSGAFELGGVSTHVYFEFDAEDLDLPCLNVALLRLVERHDMLRAVVLADGHQQVLARVDPYAIPVEDLRGVAPAEADQRLRAVSDEMSHQVLPPDRWPLFDVRAHRISDRRTRVHVSLDLLVADGRSIMTLMRDWARLYAEPDRSMPPLELTFRDYVLAKAELRRSDAYEADRGYWRDRLPGLPPAPDLPLARQPADGPPRFHRRLAALDRDTWGRLKQRAARAKVTPSALLCAAYADVLAAWSSEPRFTLNITFDDRLPIHPDVYELVGDFTSALPLEVDCAAAATFDERAQRLQAQLARDLDHRLVSAVELQRDMARGDGGGSSPRLPVVFTSMLGSGLELGEPRMGELYQQIVHSISQTPQVFLDHQVYEYRGALTLIWDAVEELFPDGLLDSMFAAYRSLLERLAAGEERGTLVPDAELAVRAQANDTAEPFGEQLLHAGFDRRDLDRLAVVAHDRSLTYGELDRCANRVARRLRELGARPNELVAVVMDKGWEQVVAVLGVLRSGAAYLPVDASLPDKRIRQLLERGEVAVALTQTPVEERVTWSAGVTVATIDDETWAGVDDGPLEEVATPADLAYVIFTSGSTGEPKGVMIDHRAAANTIADCLSRFQVTADDRILALSSLSFDLSVFDVFGALAAGATVLVPEPRAMRDPARWAGLVRDHGVTIWNSVPALLEMLVEYAGGRGDYVGDSLRLAMLSGDWIPCDLPDRLRELVPHARVIGMGGATEASIWSVLYPIERVERDWASIPYGRPMANQSMHVLDGALEPRPVWVPGELYIGGAGLARGYWRDPERTSERFVERPRTGERLYRTGDLARYLPDGNLEFLGRTDHQVKIRGYRVELGEIEAALLEHPGVRSAVVTARGEPRGAKRLVAYCVPEGPALDRCEVTDFVRERLPEYMIPTGFVSIDELPLTANGKVDRGALPDPQAAQGMAASCVAAPPAREEGSTERVVAAVWREVLGLPDIGRDEDFFDLGGDSLLAMRAVAKLGARGIRVDAEMFFGHPTIAQIAEAAMRDAPSAAEQGLVSGDVELTHTQRWFFEREFADAHHWNGFWPLIAVRDRLDPSLLGAALHKLLLHHDGLRMRFARAGDDWRGEIGGAEAAVPVPVATIDLSGVDDEGVRAAVEEAGAELQASLDLERGPALRLTYLDLGPDRPGRLHLAAHWALMDYYSSRIFFEDLRSAYDQLVEGREVELPPKTTSIQAYGRRLREHAQTPEVVRDLELWAKRPPPVELPLDGDTGPNDQRSARRVALMLPAPWTAALTTELPRAADCDVAAALLSAFGRAVSRWAGDGPLAVDVEAHGRRNALEDVDVARTIGRCSTLTPWHLDLSAAADERGALEAVVAQTREHRRRGLSYGLLRYLCDDADVRRALAEAPAPQLSFNFWGQANEYLADAIWPFAESPGALQAEAGLRPHLLEVFGLVIVDQLGLVFTYSDNLHRRDTIERVADSTAAEVDALLGAYGLARSGEPAVVALD